MTGPGSAGWASPGPARQSEGRRRGYRCLRGDPYRYGGYTLTALRFQDVQLIRRWRNAQIRVLRQKQEIHPEQQEHYYRQVVQPGFRKMRPEMILLSLLKGEHCCAYTGLTNLDWEARRAELCFLADPERVERTLPYRNDFSSCLTMLTAIAFGELGLNRLFTETYDIRPRHVAILERSGFLFEGRMRDHVMVDGTPVDSLIHGLLREDWRAGA